MYYTLLLIAIPAVYCSLENSCSQSCSDKFKTSELISPCERGCRFSAIGQFISAENESALAECEGNCESSYSSEALESCKFGCQHQEAVNPISQLMQMPPAFGPEGFNPFRLMSAFSSFFDQMSSAMDNQVESNGQARPFGIVRIVTSNRFNDEPPQTQVMSFKLGGNQMQSSPFGLFSNGFGGILPVRPELSGPSEAKENIDQQMQESSVAGMDEGNMPLSHHMRMMNGGHQMGMMRSMKNGGHMGSVYFGDRCLGPTYDSISGMKCRAYMEKWQFNTQTRKCEKFIFGGCPAVDNMFHSEEECSQSCAAYMPNHLSRRARRFETSFVYSCLGAIAICALLGALSSILYPHIRRAKRNLLYTQSYQVASNARPEDSKIFLVAPQMDWKPTAMSFPPTYSDVVTASKEQVDQKEEKKPEEN